MERPDNTVRALERASVHAEEGRIAVGAGTGKPFTEAAGRAADRTSIHAI
jgi:hypothetical protein